jgi:hypothetical protein
MYLKNEKIFQTAQEHENFATKFVRGLELNSQ